MNGIGYFNTAIEKALLSIRTAYLGKVLSISGNEAIIQPLNTYRAVGGNVEQSSTTNAFIPQNIKYKEETITYMISNTQTKTKTVLTPDNLAVGDIVFVGICDRDITHAKKGIIGEATERHHDINDGVILRVL